MKTSMKLNLKAKKLKELSKDTAKLVGGGHTSDHTQPQAQAYGSNWNLLITFSC